jgi:NAD(P) transhydrogenase subunit alpha
MKEQKKQWECKGDIMELIQYILVGVFIVSTIVGYFLINNVPSLLHTPLMSGMNALSGITIVGALLSTVAAVNADKAIIGFIFGGLAIILAMINVVGGFTVTDRMLRMFSKKGDKHE